MAEYFNIHDLGAHALQDYKVSGTKVDTQVFAGRWRTHFDVLETVPGLKNIQFTLVYTGATRNDVVMNKSRADAFLANESELLLPDGLYYTCYPSALGDLVLMGNDRDGVIGQATYKLTGFAHGELETVAGYDVFCRSTMPRTDCRITCTASADSDNYTVGGVTFSGVTAGDVVCADGITGRLLINGAPATCALHFMNFPFLVPGWQSVQAPDTPTVEYFPAYI